MATLLNIIKNSISTVTNHPTYKTWLKERRLNDGDIIAINNSFLFREDLKTTKSSKYLVLKHRGSGNFRDVYVAQNLDMKIPEFSKITDPNIEKNLTTINHAIEEELGNIGFVIFALIGKVQDDSIHTESFKKLGFSEIVWDAKNKELLTIDGSRIVVQNPFEEQSLWDALVQHCDKNNITIDEKAKNQFGTALDNLQSNAEAILELPQPRKKEFQGMLDSIIDALVARKSDYVKALSICKGKPEINNDAFVEVLRISYNFSNDIIPLLKLIISICDLKPIVFWSTVGEHYSLSEAIRNLPWTPSITKANLQNYKSMVGNARNSTFHNLFPIQKALRFSLPVGALTKTELRFFAEYTPSKAGNRFRYEDQELIELFLDFTRARQRFVPSDFWEKNVEVMDRVIDLFDATNRVLKELYRITKTK